MNTCGHSPYITSSLTRKWVCHLKLLLALASTTINSARYSEFLTDWLKPAIQNKRRGLVSKGVVLLHVSARPHTAAHTAETLRTLKSDVIHSWLSLAWSTQSGIKGLSIHLGPGSVGSGACVARCSATMDQVGWNAKGLCRKIMLI
jgi:hypothetical protein